MGILCGVIVLSAYMSFYNPEDSWPATDDELRTLYDSLRPWIVHNGIYRVGDPKNPMHGILGLHLPEGEGDLLDPEPVVVASHPPTYRVGMTGLDELLESLAPDSRRLLDIDGKLLFIFRTRFFRFKGAEEQGEYVTPDCSVAIPQPQSRPDLRLRSYLLDLTMAGTVSGTRQDKATLDGEITKRSDTGMFPLITHHECQALLEIGGVCMSAYDANPKHSDQPQPES